MRFFKFILALSLFASVGLADTNVNTKTLQETLDNIDNWLGALSAADTNVSFYLPGTNIVGATYSSVTDEWSINWSDILNTFPFLDTDYRNDGTGTGTVVSADGSVFRVNIGQVSVTNVWTLNKNYYPVTNILAGSILDNSAGWNPTNSTYTIPNSGYYLVGVSVVSPYNNTGGGTPSKLSMILYDESTNVPNWEAFVLDGFAPTGGSDNEENSFSFAAPVFLEAGTVISLRVRNQHPDGSSNSSVLWTFAGATWFITSINAGGGSDYVVDSFWTNTYSFESPADVVTGRPFDTGWVDFSGGSTLFNKGTGVFSPQTNKAYVIDYGATVIAASPSNYVTRSVGLVKNNSFPTSTRLDITNSVSYSYGYSAAQSTPYEMAHHLNNVYYTGLVTDSNDYYRIGFVNFSYAVLDTTLVQNAYFRVREVTP